MALVIDDRLKVWDEKDQPRVHVVPAFAPYYAPQAEVMATYFKSLSARITQYFSNLYRLFLGQQQCPCALCCKKCSLQCERWFFQVR